MAVPKQKAVQNEDGSLEVTLPVSKAVVTIRPPKGKDLKAMETAAKSGDQTGTGMLMIMLAQLCVTPSYSLDDLDEMDLQDLGVLGVALDHFPAFVQLAKRQTSVQS